MNCQDILSPRIAPKKYLHEFKTFRPTPTLSAPVDCGCLTPHTLTVIAKAYESRGREEDPISFSEMVLEGLNKNVFLATPQPYKYNFVLMFPGALLLGPAVTLESHLFDGCTF